MAIKRTPARRCLLSILAACLAAAFLAGLPAANAAAGQRPRQYVAIGDSYSAGVGTTGPIADERCYRSPFGYPALVAQSAGWQLDYRACSGATTASVLAEQLSTLTPETDEVSIGVGGNDAGFAPVMAACAFGKPGECTLALAAAGLALRGLPAGLDAVYQQVIAKAPNAKIVVVGYPRLFYRDDCSPAIEVTRAEMLALNLYADALNSVVRQRARVAGLAFVDVREAFSGHAICTARPYLNTYVADPVWQWDSFHPNRDGYAAYAREVSRALRAGGAGSSA